MRFFQKAPDGGKNSGVTGYFLVEIKSLFSIVLLKFEQGSREAYHNHAFNALTIWLKGEVAEMLEERKGDLVFLSNRFWKAGQFKYTPRSLMHRIFPLTTAWALSIRGPWNKTWQESRDGELVTLTNGRQEVYD